MRHMRRWAIATLCTVMAFSAVAWMWSVKPGDVDPAGATIASVSAVLTLIAILPTRAAQRRAEQDLEYWAKSLADQVAETESAQRDQLLGRVEAIDVRFTVRSAGSAASISANPGGSIRRVVDFYWGLEAPRRLVITGGPGAGKTVLAVELILKLLKYPLPGGPVPVRVSAAGWDPRVLPLIDWLSGHLANTFTIGPRLARKLVEAGRVLPVIDGLDEMDDVAEPGFNSRAGLALQALNERQVAGERFQFILTCRTDQYKALVAGDADAREAVQVEIGDVAEEEAWKFIQVLTGHEDPIRWQPVLDALTNRGHVLSTALATPWRLTLAASVYTQRDKADDYLHDPADLAAMTSETQIRDHLLSSFIPARIAALRHADQINGRASQGKYTAEQAHAWLAVLATYLNNNAATGRRVGNWALSSTDIVLHEIWPLAGTRRIHAVCSGLIIGMPWLLVSISKLQPFVVPVGFLSPFIILALVSAKWIKQPKIRRVDWRQLRSRRDRKGADGLLALFIPMGAAWGSELAPKDGVVFGYAYAIIYTLILGVGFASVKFLIDAAQGPAEARTPLDPLRSNTRYAVSIGITSGVTAALFLIPAGVPSLATLWVGLIWGLVKALAGLRYLALLLCTRQRNGRWLPWRLGRFMQWCNEVGIVRISGIAYQFRHRELQDYLARHPTSS